MSSLSDKARRWVYVGVFAAMAASLTAGSYLFIARLLKDRQSAMNFDRRPSTADVRRRQTTTTQNKDGTTRTTHVPGQGPAATAAGEAAIQRQLRTLEEINKINEMNRRLMDQQQRMQRQQN